MSANKNKSSKAQKKNQTEKSENKAIQFGKDSLNILKSQLKGLEAGGRLIKVVEDVLRGKVGDATIDLAKAISIGATRPVENAVLHYERAKNLFNHKTWYTKDNPNLVNANYGTIVGYQSQYGKPTFTLVSLGTELTIPTAAAGKLLPSNSDDWNTGVQILYNQLRSVNSGAANYTVTDLAVYLYNARSMVALLSTIRKLLRAVNTFRTYDRTFPNVIINQHGFDCDSVVENAAELRNIYSNTVKKFLMAYPLNNDLLSRTKWMFSNIFKDDTSANASCYQFSLLDVSFITQAADKTYSVNSHKLMNKLIFNIEGGELDTPRPSAYLNTLMVDALKEIGANTTDNKQSANIAGDMIKAFGASSMFTATDWEVDSTIELVHDPEILRQIQNITFVSAPMDFRFAGDALATPRVTINEAGLHQGAMTGLTVNNSAGASSYNSLARTKSIDVPINTYANFMDSGDTLSATRLMCQTTATDGSDPVYDLWPLNYTFSNVGTEVVCCPIITIDSAGEILSFGLPACYGNVIGGHSVEYFYWLGMFGRVDWFPELLFVTPGHNLSQTYLISDIWDYQNFALVDSSFLGTVHGIATRSLLQPNSKLTDVKDWRAEVDRFYQMVKQMKV